MTKQKYTLAERRWCYISPFNKRQPQNKRNFSTKEEQEEKVKNFKLSFHAAEIIAISLHRWWMEKETGKAKLKGWYVRLLFLNFSNGNFVWLTNENERSTKKKWMHRTDCCGSVCVLRIFARFVTLVNCNLIFPACLVNGIWICLQFAVCSDCWIWMCAVGCRNRYIFTLELGRNFDRQAKRYCNYMISYDALHHILQCKQIDEDFEQVAFMSNECEGSLLCFQCKFHHLLFAVVFDSITENHN